MIQHLIDKTNYVNKEQFDEGLRDSLDPST